MRRLLFLLEKEFRQTFRNPNILRSVMIMPVIQLIIFPNAANYEVKNVALSIVDHDHSSYSQQFAHKISASRYFKLVRYTGSYNQAFEDVEKDNADIVIEIPQHFEKDLVTENKATLYMAVNAVNGAKASLGGAYASSIINEFNGSVRTEWITIPRFPAQPTISVTSSNWYNPTLNYKLYMVPGILVTLLTMIGTFLSSLNIVHEKEIGTIEQINVSPIKKWEFILGKLLPFWILGLVTLSLGLLVARFIYGIVPVGSIALIYLFAMVFLLALLGIGLLISTYSETQTQATFIGFFVMMLFMLLGGLYTSIDAMPEWAIWITKLNPVAYFIESIRMIILKGSTFADIKNNLLSVLGLAVVFNSWAIWNYRKRN